MKILVIGSGGREHALVWKLKQSSAVDRIFCAPSNGGTQAISENVPIPATSLPQLRDFAKKNKVDLVVVGPDDPLAMGIVDLFTENRLRIFGPSKAAARLEPSKIFAKELMRSQNVPTAPAQTLAAWARSVRRTIGTPNFKPDSRRRSCVRSCAAWPKKKSHIAGCSILD